MPHAGTTRARKPNIPHPATAPAALLAAGIIVSGAWQRRAMRRAVECERRRIRRDLHDGLSQELAFIATLAQRLEQAAPEEATVAHLRSASERALLECRSALTDLAAAEDAPLEQLMGRTADLFHSRFGAQIEVELQGHVPCDRERRNALLRILNEALTNAVRHGRARSILVRLVRGERASSLSVRDDGSGFDVDAALAAGQGVGLANMRERAELLGGRLDILSTPGSGTLVEVVLP